MKIIELFKAFITWKKNWKTRQFLLEKNIFINHVFYENWTSSFMTHILQMRNLAQSVLYFFSLGAFKIAYMYLLIKTHYNIKRGLPKKEQRRQIPNKKWQKGGKNNLHNWTIGLVFHFYITIFSKSHYILKPKSDVLTHLCQQSPT